MNKIRFRAGVPVLATVFLLLSSCVTNPITGKKNLVLISEDQEIQMGKEADPQIIAQYGLYPNQTLQNFINEKGKKMGAISHRPNLDYQFRVLDSPVVNAFAVPGGYVYFTRGIMAYLNDEAQFAGVLGHEIGHIAARHTARAQSKQILFQGVLVAGMAVSPDLAQFSDLSQEALGLLFLKFSRDNETEADHLGVEYSTKIGYNAHEMADFFQTLKRVTDSGGGSLPTFLSTHPDPANRYKKVNEWATEEQASLDKSKLQVNRDAYLRLVDGLVYGEDPRQGFVENGVFYHPELKFQFPIPTDWMTQNSPADFRMAPKDGKALMILALADGATLDEAVQKVVQDNNLSVVDSKRQTVNGFPAQVVLADLVDAQNPQQVIRLLTYFIQDGKTIYKFHGMALSADYPNYAPLFVNTMSGFKRLTDPNKLNRQPELLKVATVSKTATVRETLQSLKIPADRLDEFAIVNGMDLNGTVQAGTLIKVLK